ncbi:MAG: hypothetical protein LBB85_07445 [Dysgonamonadaceae bacterium]|jgi:hypothetical protein|nr:hypothetical protein [Dysgonamonadaceae bacterium]
MMNTLNIATYSVIELSYNDMKSIEGGGELLDKFLDFAKDASKAIGYGVGYAAGAVKDFVLSGDVAANETLMNCI